jgi:hypothetical protein
MAFTPTNQLTSDQHITLRDQEHAARLFADDQFRLAPKLDFQFHVAFNINPAALKTIDLVQRHRNELNMLVKSVTLPKFTATVEQVQQYNRKKNVQSLLKYDDMTITFNDDNMGVVNQMWQNYYSYYYADPSSAGQAGAYDRTATRNSNYITTNYGLDNGSTQPFFNYITIYQLSRHEYVSYKLWNPIIKTWDHKTVQYDSSKTHESSMILTFEAVSYGQGVVSSDTVEGFGIEHYDQTPSPLTGGGNTGITPNFNNNQLISSNASQFLNNVINTVNGYQNTQTTNTANVANLSNSTTQGVSGIQGIAFPITNAANAVNTTATVVNLGI